MAFNMSGISAVFNEASLAVKDNSNYNFKLIDIDELVPNPDNRYEITEIDKLMVSVAAWGVKQPLEVEKIDNGKYKIIAGERRYTAVKRLVEEEKREDLKQVPCLIQESKDLKIKDESGNIIELPEEVLERWRIRTTNEEQRNKTDGEILMEIQEQKELYGILSELGYQFSGKMRDIIASQLGMSASQVQRYEFIDKNLNVEMKEEFKKGNIPLTVAVEAAKQHENIQDTLTEKIKKDGSISAQDIKEVVKESKPKKKVDLKPKEINATIIDGLLTEMQTIQESLDSSLTVSGKDFIKIEDHIKVILKKLESINKIISKTL
ncbi:MAG: ParB N-terminal domain-containing protein [Oscillospiraceae bacterium]